MKTQLLIKQCVHSSHIRCFSGPLKGCEFPQSSQSAQQLVDVAERRPRHFLELN